VQPGYFFLALLRLEVLAGALVLTLSVSRGAGGGVVSIVHPIQADITRTSRTNSSTGIPIAHCAQEGGSPMYGAKNAAK
jgi:hypothetical protein